MELLGRRGADGASVSTLSVPRGTPPAGLLRAARLGPMPFVPTWVGQCVLTLAGQLRPLTSAHRPAGRVHCRRQAVYARVVLKHASAGQLPARPLPYTLRYRTRTLSVKGWPDQQVSSLKPHRPLHSPSGCRPRVQGPWRRRPLGASRLGHVAGRYGPTRGTKGTPGDAGAVRARPARGPAAGALNDGCRLIIGPVLVPRPGAFSMTCEVSPRLGKPRPCLRTPSALGRLRPLLVLHRRSEERSHGADHWYNRRQR